MPRKKKQSRAKSYVYLLINTVCWGAALIVVKPALSTTTPFRFLLYRYFFASVFSLPILFHFWQRVRNRTKKIKTIFKLDFIGTVLALAFLYIGLARTTAIEASLLTSTTPIFIVLAGIFLLKEKQEKHEWFGLMLAFVGTIFLTAVPFLNGYFINQGLSFMGNLLIIGHNISTAVYFVWAKKEYKNIPKFFVTTISFYLGIFSFLLLSLWELDFSTQTLIQNIISDFTQQSVWIASLYMALFGSIIGLTAYIKGQEGIEASEASLFWYLQPLVYIPLGIVLLNEHVSIYQIGALAVILIGVVVTEKRQGESRSERG